MREPFAETHVGFWASLSFQLVRFIVLLTFAFSFGVFSEFFLVCLPVAFPSKGGLPLCPSFAQCPVCLDSVSLKGLYRFVSFLASCTLSSYPFRVSSFFFPLLLLMCLQHPSFILTPCIACVFHYFLIHAKFPARFRVSFFPRDCTSRRVH